MATAIADKKTVKKAAPKKGSETKVKEAPRLVRQAHHKQARGDSGFAIIETGGKQYRAIVGESIKIEKLSGNYKEGSEVVFDKVLLSENGAKTSIGTPYITGSKVTGIITEIGRNAKVIVIKYKQKSRYFKKNGHRQPFFKVKIVSII